ncbi:uncharacterized protein LOC106179229 isoform X3 [Lingula anatina]|uniref:Uncharacterized protein LOC106179229 isoform X2 n=1 Tax=Lingula anatina TaxID=7574 RepID=A0A1S3K7H9_LINAN|nr:uncharacterized protein LOC106179229 isoform X2 [Lingula anatina]XP_013418222.1 uncharacterized protein LOC106179229 isoform X3 [Lingula anatina]|eukprot:XP_013418221.1 uncharacterized protein LOC106179229 isoform X2 [Lingula anatina]
MLKIALLLCLVGLAASDNYFGRGMKAQKPMMEKRCAGYHTNKLFVCRDEYLPGGSFTQKVPIKGKDHHKQTAGYRIETVSYEPSKKLYFAYAEDETCYWQCDSQGMAVLRPCPTGTMFEEDMQTCGDYRGIPATAE